jgi:hypothetical protein
LPSASWRCWLDSIRLRWRCWKSCPHSDGAWSFATWPLSPSFQPTGWPGFWSGWFAHGSCSVAADAAAAGELFATIQALQTQGFAAAFRGRFGEAEAVVRRSNAIAQAEGRIYRLTVGLTNLGIVLAAQGRSRHAVEALTEGKAVNPEWRHSILPEWEVIVHWFTGDYGAALACADDAAARAVGDLSKRRALGVLFAALPAVEAGQGRQARQYLDSARRAFGSRDWQFFSHYCGYVQGLLDWQEGRLSDASARLSDAARRVVETGAQPYGALVLVDLAEVAAESGDAGGVAAAAQQLQAIAARTCLRPAREITHPHEPSCGRGSAGSSRCDVRHLRGRVAPQYVRNNTMTSWLAADASPMELDHTNVVLPGFPWVTG